MANFQTHLTVAAAGSMTATAVCVQTGIVSHPEALLLLSLGTMAGILPDIDSDHSVPTRLVFNIISFAVATAALFALQGKVHLVYILGISLLSALFVRYIVYALFAGITEHRGLFHSLPAALLVWPDDRISRHPCIWLARRFCMAGRCLCLWRLSATPDAG